MNDVLKHASLLFLLCTAAEFAACTTPEFDVAAVGLQAANIVNGQLADATEASHTLLLRGGQITCTGVAISPSHIVTAAHCLPKNATVVSYELYSGRDATECISDNEEHCVATSFDVAKHPSADLAILSTRQKLVGFEYQKLPLLYAGGGSLSAFTSLGYGAGSYVDENGKTVTSPTGSHLLTGGFTVESTSEHMLTAKAAAGRAAACAGDSGGPALVRLPSGGEALIGTLLYSDSGENCTDENGTDTWLRLEAYLPFIETTIGTCARTYDGPWIMADCRGTGALTRDRVTDSATDAALDELLAGPGVKKYESGIDPRRATQTLHESSTGSIATVVTAKGQYLLTFAPDELHAAVGDMFGDSRAPRGSAILRGWSDGVDNRTRLSASTLVPEIGELSTAFANPNSTITCTGTLIGHRIVRTAAHCVVKHTTSGGQIPDFGNAATFRYRRNGSTNYVETLSDMIIWGGSYISTGCSTSTASNYNAGYNDNEDNCSWSDWALIVLPPNWHSSSAVSWMGYEILTASDLNRRHQFAGYPFCTSGIPDRPAVCFAHNQYLDSSNNCRIKAWLSEPTRWLSGCDASEGQSGGPAFDSTTRSLLGHDQYSYCTTCIPSADAENRPAPNVFLGSDAFLFDFQSTLRLQYP